MKIEIFEPDTVNVTLITLGCGKVIGIDTESIVLYESMSDFLEFDLKDRPTISIEG